MGEGGGGGGLLVLVGGGRGRMVRAAGVGGWGRRRWRRRCWGGDEVRCGVGVLLLLCGWMWVGCVCVIKSAKVDDSLKTKHSIHQSTKPKQTTKQTKASDTGLAEHPELVQALVGELMPEARRLYEGALAAALSSMTSQQGYVKGSVCGICGGVVGGIGMTRCHTVSDRDAAARRREQRAFEEQLEAASMVGVRYDR